MHELSENKLNYLQEHYQDMLACKFNNKNNDEIKAMAKKRINLINNSVKMAGFPKIKSLAEFDFEYQPTINKQQIEDFNSLRFIENKENIILYGNSGVGDRVK